MSLTISREQRDAIYELVVTHLTGIGDVWIELENRDIATSKRLARAFVEDLHLLNDLGWDETIDSERVTLTVPPGELVRTLARLHREAAGALGTYVSRPKDEEAVAQRNVTASAALAEVLSQLASAWHCRRCGWRRGGFAMTAVKRSSEEAIVAVLGSKRQATVSEIAAAAGLAGSTVARVLARLERGGRARRSAGSREGGRRLPDCWAPAAPKRPARRRSSGKRLRPGELDRLVLDYLAKHAESGPLSPTAVANGLGRSAGAVGNCLARLAAAGRVRQVGERPRRYNRT